MSLPQRGNILFLILLAVVLFAALAYAVTQSLRGGGKDGGAEKMDLVAAQLLQNMNLIETTMTRAMMINGIKEWGFDFNRPGGTASTNNTCQQTECRIFTEKNGPVPYFDLPVEAMSDPSQNKGYYNVAQVVNVGTSAPDILVSYNYVSAGFCSALNKALNLNDISMTVSDSIGGTDNNYSGTLTSIPPSTGIIGDTNATLVGKKAACYPISTSPPIYRFHYVIMER